MRTSSLFSGASMVKTSITIFRIFFPLLVIGAAAAICVVLLRPIIMYEGIFDDNAAWGGFLNVFGVIYAIVAGFLLVTVLTRFSDLNQTLQDELHLFETFSSLWIRNQLMKKAGCTGHCYIMLHLWLHLSGSKWRIPGLW